MLQSQSRTLTKSEFMCSWLQFWFIALPRKSFRAVKHQSSWFKLVDPLCFKNQLDHLAFPAGKTNTVHPISVSSIYFLNVLSEMDSPKDKTPVFSGYGNVFQQSEIEQLQTHPVLFGFTRLFAIKGEMCHKRRVPLKTRQVFSGDRKMTLLSSF